MTHQNDYSLTNALAEKGLDAVPKLLRVLINNVMQAERSKYLQAEQYEWTEDRKGHTNGYKPKTVRTRIGEITFAVPQLREGGFYPSELEKGLRSERALVTTIFYGLFNLMMPITREGIPTTRNGATAHQRAEFIPPCVRDKIIKKAANKISTTPRKINRCPQNIFPAFFSLRPTKKLINSKKISATICMGISWNKLEVNIGRHHRFQYYII
jgi:hypothetical protein